MTHSFGKILTNPWYLWSVAPGGLLLRHKIWDLKIPLLMSIFSPCSTAQPSRSQCTAFARLERKIVGWITAKLGHPDSTSFVLSNPQKKCGHVVVNPCKPTKAPPFYPKLAVETCRNHPEMAHNWVYHIGQLWIEPDPSPSGWDASGCVGELGPDRWEGYEFPKPLCLGG